MSGALWQPVYVGVGSNLKQPIEQVRTALDELKRVPQSRLVDASRLYRSQPVGPPGQPDYVNAVAGLLTQLAPLAFLEQLQKIEQAHGRERSGERWTARTLDLDILCYAHQVMSCERLIVPHKELHRRDFVLGPWLDIAPDLAVAGLGRVRMLADHLDLSTLCVIDSDGDNDVSSH